MSAQPIQPHDPYAPQIDTSVKRVPSASPSSSGGSEEDEGDDIGQGGYDPDDTNTTPSRQVLCATPGRLSEDVYEQTLVWWRAAVRRRLVASVEVESRVLARMQERIRTPWLDRYFVYTSSLGTHTFFMTALPACFFFGYPEFGHGLIFVLALGVYASSFIKDLFCSPRPFAPPVTRLTIGTHHLEYGFPSTHSTNSVSIALFILTRAERLAAAGTLGPTGIMAARAGLALYATSIVLGRLYTAMHSFTDCAVGVLLGTAIWAAHWAAEDSLQRWIYNGGWSMPLMTVTLGLIMVHKHPQPVDDCPCFEDAIAFVSVVMGIVLGWWHGAHHAPPLITLFPTFAAAPAPALWPAFALLKLVIGVGVIFAWRLLAKALLRLALPPLFRALAHAFVLPHRRFYTPATDYAGAVPLPPGGGIAALRSIPSVIDLPTHLEVEMDLDVEGMGSSASGRGKGAGARKGGEVKMRGTRANGHANGHAHRDAEKPALAMPPVSFYPSEKALLQGTVDDADVPAKHYDADVLTKVIVYCGIAILAEYVLPVTFEALGWSAPLASRAYLRA